MTTQDPEKSQMMDLPPPVTKPNKAGEMASPELITVPASSGPELSVAQPAQSLQSAQTDDSQQPVAPVPQQQSQVQNGVVDDDMPQIADDIDLIEKEWVEKAKQIVEKTKDDPRAQNEEISKVKAVYQKKRFNRDALADKGK